MRAILGSIGFFALVLLGSAQAQYVFQGRSTPLSTRMVSGHKAAAGAAYQGPLDVVSGAKAYYLTDSCAFAASTNLTIMDVLSDNTTTPAHATRRVCNNGVVSDLVSSTACSFLTAWTTTAPAACSTMAVTCATACVVFTLYDQSGGTNCTTACDLLGINGGTPSFQAPLAQTGPGSHWCINTSTNNNTTLFTNNVMTTQIQPFTIAIMANRLSGTADLYGPLGSKSGTGSDIRAGWTNVANTTSLYSGASIVTGPTASDVHFHSLGYVFNGSSSQISVDGALTSSLSLGNTNSFNSQVTVADEGFTNTTSVAFCEGGIWGSPALTSPQFNSLYTNQKTRYANFP